MVLRDNLRAAVSFVRFVSALEPTLCLPWNLTSESERIPSVNCFG